MQEAEQVYLLLADGSCFPGRRAGAKAKDEFAELVFTTAAGSDTEILTDPAFSGKIILRTFPISGAAGYCREDMQRDFISCLGYCVKQISDFPSNFRADGSLDRLLKEEDIPAVTGIDTRMICGILREKGSMNAVITSDPESIDLNALKEFTAEPQLPKVSTSEVSFYPAIKQKKHQPAPEAALIDLGAKRSTLRFLRENGCGVKVFPYTASAEEILAAKPDGILFCGGPGDPRDYPELIESCRTLMQSPLPVLGIGFGHLLMAASSGLKLEKMKQGHRGNNQAVKSSRDGKIYMSAQNHAYVVRDEGLYKKGAEVSFRNVHDKSIEGLDYVNSRNFSWQFYPEGAAGPEDTKFLYKRFINALEAQDAAGY